MIMSLLLGSVAKLRRKAMGIESNYEENEYLFPRERTKGKAGERIHFSL